MLKPIQAACLEPSSSTAKVSAPMPDGSGPGWSKRCWSFHSTRNGAAGCHHHHVFIPVEPGIDRHRYDRTVPHQGHNAFVFHQLGRDLPGQFRVPLVVLDDVLDRSAMDAAIGVDAIEKRRGRIGSSREVSGRRVAVDATHLDGLSGGRLAVAQPAFRAVAICHGRRRRPVRSKVVTAANSQLSVSFHYPPMKFDDGRSGCAPSNLFEIFFFGDGAAFALGLPWSSGCRNGCSGSIRFHAGKGCLPSVSGT